MTTNSLEGRYDTEMPAAGAVFENSFMSLGLEDLISHCDHYEIVDYFRKWIPDHQPVLEAGCGSGRWVGWFVKNGWQAAGLDWSEACCERARKLIPQARFVAGDMRDMPFADGEFGSIVSLGAVEHSAEGPLRSLKEYRRVLRSGGIAIITVPYLSLARRWSHVAGLPALIIKRSNLIRTLLGKKKGARTIREAKAETNPDYSAEFVMTEKGWEFYQYHFTKPQMRDCLADAGLEITEEFVEFGDEGILHNFGRIAGKYNFAQSKVELSLVGRLLRNFLPIGTCGHMLCYLVKKP